MTRIQQLAIEAKECVIAGMKPDNAKIMMMTLEALDSVIRNENYIEMIENINDKKSPYEVSK